MKRISWRELRKICLLLGCVDARMRGDHLIMTRPGLARPIVIKMARELGDDIILSNLRTLGIERKRFEELLDQIRKRKKN